MVHIPPRSEPAVGAAAGVPATLDYAPHIDFSVYWLALPQDIAGPTMRTMSRIAAHRWSIAAASITTLLSLGTATPTAAQTPSMTPAERAAVQVVRDWFAAWQTKDPQKVASLMSPNVEFRPVPDRPIAVGRDAFVKSEARLLQGGPQARLTEVIAIGGPAGTAVLVKRTDMLTLDNGQTRVVGPFAAFFRVDHGQIQEWLDMPLVPRGPTPGAAAGAAKPAATGAN
jgi:uncharacterized protein (TIGR02246 family)